MATTGYDCMPRIVAHATADIRAHLWTIYWLARSINANSIVELGVRSGDSTRSLLAAAADIAASTRHPVGRYSIQGRLPTVRSYDIAGDAYRVREVTESAGIPWGDIGGDRWSCTQMDSLAAASAWDFSTVDLLFVDTEHSYAQTRAEIDAWYGKIRPGGLMVFHDTTLDEPDRIGVTPACLDFVGSNPGWLWECHPHVGEGDNGLGWLTRLPTAGDNWRVSAT